MKETPKSLKIYFWIIGILGLLSGAISVGSGTLNAILSGIISLALSIVIIYMAYHLDRLLKTSAQKVINFFYLVLGLNVVQQLVNFLAVDPGAQQFSMAGLIGFAVRIIILLYIIKNIKRLSASR